MLRHLFPSLGPPVEGLALRYTEPSEFRTRLYWHFSSLLTGLARQRSLLVILEDVHWADPSSLELLHFVAQQTATEPIIFVCLYSDPDPERRKALLKLEQSLASMNACLSIDLGPLTCRDTEDLLGSVFEVSGSEVEGFAERLFEWTAGNPFFVVPCPPPAATRCSLDCCSRRSA